MTVVELPFPDPVPDPLDLCHIYAKSRVGLGAGVAGSFQRLGVSYDGALVVFEVTNDFSFFPAVVSEGEDEGFFMVNADGTGLRWLGPASRHSNFLAYPAPSPLFDVAFNVTGTTAFSPDDHTIVYTDLGPGAGGKEAIQIVTVDLATGTRTQVTRLPPASSRVPSEPATSYARFLDDQTISFFSYANPDGLNPGGDLRTFTVGVDGTDLRVLPVPVAQLGSRVVPEFRLTGTRTNLLSLALSGTPVNRVPYDLFSVISEIFVLDGKRLLQLTASERVDTFDSFLSPNGRRAFFIASADPLGTNPLENCQLFSVDTLGGRHRQHTYFGDGQPSQLGCDGISTGRGPGCDIQRPVLFDPVTKSIVFYSSCDPFGTNPFGGQAFAMRANGAGLRQLTHTRDVVTEADGTLIVELPGPIAHPALAR